MEIIDDLEPTKRGIYGGVIGYLDFSGNVDTAIAIRTMVVAPTDAPRSRRGPASWPTATRRARTPSARTRLRPSSQRWARPGAWRPCAWWVRRDRERRRTSDPGAALGDYDALFHGFAACRIERDAVVVQGPDATTYLQAKRARMSRPSPSGERPDAPPRARRQGGCAVPHHAHRRARLCARHRPRFRPRPLGPSRPVQAACQVRGLGPVVRLRGPARSGRAGPERLRRLGGWTLEQKDPACRGPARTDRR